MSTSKILGLFYIALAAIYYAAERITAQQMWNAQKAAVTMHGSESLPTLPDYSHCHSNPIMWFCLIFGSLWTIAGKKINDRITKHCLPPEYLSLTAAQRKFVDRGCITPLQRQSITILHLLMLFGFPAGFYLLGSYCVNRNLKELLMILTILANALLISSLNFYHFRRNRSKIADFVLSNIMEIEAADRHQGVQADCIPILEHSEYARFIAEDPERRYIYRSDLPKQFFDWLKNQHQYSGKNEP